MTQPVPAAPVLAHPTARVVIVGPVDMNRADRTSAWAVSDQLPSCRQWPLQDAGKMGHVAHLLGVQDAQFAEGGGLKHACDDRFTDSALSHGMSRAMV